MTAAEGPPVKVISEMVLLSAGQLHKAVALAVEAGASYLKNLSGGAVDTATAEQVKHLGKLAPAHVKVKASGGIRTRSRSAASRCRVALVGTSHGVDIVSELKGTLQTGQTPTAEPDATDY